MRHITEPTVASTLQECLKVAQEARANTGFPLILVGTTSDVEKIPLSVIGLFKEEVAIEVRQIWLSTPHGVDSAKTTEPVR